MVKMENLMMKHEDKVAQAKKFFQESTLKQFWKYMNRHNVLEIFQPSLTLLYELPIKPKNLHEFFAEFLENGAIDLVKISHLQAELCYKHNELHQLHRDNENILKKPSLLMRDKEDSTSSTKLSVDLLQTMSVSKSLAMQSVYRISGDINDPFDLAPLIEYYEEIEARLQRRESVVSRIFKLEEPPDRQSRARSTGRINRNGHEGLDKFDNRRESNASNSTDLSEKLKYAMKAYSQKTPRESLRSNLPDPKISKLKRKSIPKIIPLQTKEDNLHQPSVKLMDTKGTQVSSNDIPLTSNSQQNPRISKLVSGIEDIEERLAMENVLLMIADHKEIDPSGILFDFNLRNSEREYELEIFARGGSEKLLRKLSFRKLPVRKSSFDNDGSLLQLGSMSEELLENLDEDPNPLETDGDGIMTIYNAEEEPINKKLSEAEAKEILTNENHRRLIRDGLKLLRDQKRTDLKILKQERRMRRSTIIGTPQKCIDCSSDSDSIDDITDNESTQRSRQLLRILADSLEIDYEEKLPLNKILSEGFKPSVNIDQWSDSNGQKQHIMEQPSITVVDFDATKETLDKVTYQVDFQPKLQNQRVNNKTLRRMLGELYSEYKKHLELLHFVIEPGEKSIYIPGTIEDYEKELEKHFQARVRLRRDEALIAIQTRLRKLLNKSRQFRVKQFLKKRGNCKNIGYTKFEAFLETKRKEALHRAYAITVPLITQKEFQHFLESFDSKGNFNSDGFRTKTDFVYDFPLDQVKATQRWIDKNFKESIWKLNEPLGDPEEDHGFDDDDDDNYIWMEDYNEKLKILETKPVPEGQAHDENLPISPRDLQMIHAHIDRTESCLEIQPVIIEKDSRQIQVVEEKILPKVTQLVYSQSVMSLLHSRPPRKSYNEIKPSERARRYVEQAFKPEVKEMLLKNFAFEMFDDDD